MFVVADFVVQTTWWDVQWRASDAGRNLVAVSIENGRRWPEVHVFE